MTTLMQRPRFWVAVAVSAIFMMAMLAVASGKAAEPAASASAGKAVTIKNFTFKPGALTVKRGTSVAFVNASNTAHTASSGSFDTKRIAPGKSKLVQFGKRGTFAYHCKIHPFMKGKIVVE
jgi:plastocyanin